MKKVIFILFILAISHSASAGFEQIARQYVWDNYGIELEDVTQYHIDDILYKIKKQEVTEYEYEHKPEPETAALKRFFENLYTYLTNIMTSDETPYVF